MTVQIKTEASKVPEVVETAVSEEAAAAAEMAAQAQLSQEEIQPKPVIPSVGDNPDDNPDDWAEFIDESDEDEVIPEAAKANAEEKVKEIPLEEVVPAVEAEETPPVEELVPSTEEVVAVEETPEVEVPAVVPEETPPETRTSEEVTAALQEARSKAHETLVEQYTMTEEQVEEFRENPKELLATMAADMYLDTYDSIMQAVQQQIPQMVQGIMVQNNQRQEADKAFFGAWPQLAKSEYRATIDRIAQNYRTMNPTTGNDDAIKEIGAQAWVALRLPLDQLLAHTSGKPQEVKTPPAPAPASRTPASPGNASTAQLNNAPVELNEFEMLAEEFIEEDLHE